MSSAGNFSSDDAVLSMQNIKWSTDQVLQQTLEQARKLKLRVAPLHTLPTLQDIDTLQVCTSKVIGDISEVDTACAAVADVLICSRCAEKKATIKFKNLFFFV